MADPDFQLRRGPAFEGLTMIAEFWLLFNKKTFSFLQNKWGGGGGGGGGEGGLPWIRHC